jgi:hypothetical protein
MEKLGISWDSVTFCRLFIGYPPWKKVINMDIYGISWDFIRWVIYSFSTMEKNM